MKLTNESESKRKKNTKDTEKWLIDAHEMRNCATNRKYPRHSTATAAAAVMNYFA